MRAGTATNLCNSRSSGCSVGSEICREMSNLHLSDSRYANKDFMSPLEIWFLVATSINFSSFLSFK